MSVAPEEDAGLSALVALFRSAPVALLTGAGVSTDSGIPDYRGAGSPPRTPMRIDQFLGDDLYRRRFWAGAAVSGRRTTTVAPNAGHRAIAWLEAHGSTEGVITQNVDNLHREAGSATVVELHGNGNLIVCTRCGEQYERHAVLAWFEAQNPGYLDSQSTAEIAPDGDASVTGITDVVVPECPACGGILRPAVVYFGEFVPPQVFAEAESLVERAHAFVIAGSSLAVNTGMRLVHRAARRGIPIAVINRGPTAADARATLRLDRGTTETLVALTRELSAPT